MSEAQLVIAKSMSEKALSDNIVSLARMLGWLVHRDPTWRATGTDAGYPDLTLIRRGVAIFAELKRESGRLTDEQRRWWADGFSWFADSGPVHYYEWRPSQWLNGEIEEVLR